MSIDRIVMAFAGTMVLLSLLLAQLFSPWWLLLTAFVGVNLLQAAFTGPLPIGDSPQALRRQIRSGLLDVIDVQHACVSRPRRAQVKTLDR